MFKHILVAIDGSEEAQRVIEVACSVAKESEAPLTLVHVPQSETTALAVGAIAGLHAAMAMPTATQIKTAGQEVLDRGVARAILSGCPTVTPILRLIVTGRRGLGGLGTLVLGSTSQRIAHLAECSCLTVV